MNNANLKFFKDQKFLLVYFYYENQYRVDLIPDILVNSEGASTVISARGGEQTDGYLIMDDIAHTAPPLGQNWRSVFFQFTDKSDEEIREIFDDEEGFNLIKNFLDFGKSKFIKQFIVLSYFDENDPNFLDGLDAHEVVKYKIGGVDVVIEYLLSKYNRKLIELTANEELSDFDKKIEFNKHPSLDSRYKFDFEYSDDLNEMQEVHYHFSWDDSPDLEIKRYVFNINENKVFELNQEICIPNRINELLTDEQKNILKDQNIEILTRKMDFIGLEVFGQKYASYDLYRAKWHSMIQSQIWNQSMGSILEDDGYLGDGIYIKKDGSINYD